MDRISFALAGGMTIKDVTECARVAEEQDYHSVVMGDGGELDALVSMAACATVTRKLNLGTSILSVFMRTPTQTALGAAAVDMLSEGRFTLGLGSSHKVQVKAHHGVKYEKPIERIKETIEIIRAIFRGGNASYDGEIFKIDNFRFLFKPFRENLPIRIAALNPKMLQMAGEMADGVVLFQQTTERVKQSMEYVKRGMSSGGRNSTNQFETALNVYAAVSRNAGGAKKAVKKRIAWTAGYFPRYNNLLIEEGFPQEAGEIRQAWLRGDTDTAINAVTDAIVDSVAVAGTPEQCRAKLDEFRNAGVTLPILIVCPIDGNQKTATVEAMRLLR